MNALNALTQFASMLGENPINNGKLEFPARIIYKWQDKMQQDEAVVLISLADDNKCNIHITKAVSFYPSLFHLKFSNEHNEITAREHVLMIKGSSDKMNGEYTVEIIPETGSSLSPHNSDSFL